MEFPRSLCDLAVSPVMSLIVISGVMLTPPTDQAATPSISLFIDVLTRRPG